MKRLWVLLLVLLLPVAAFAQQGTVVTDPLTGNQARVVNGVLQTSAGGGSSGGSATSTPPVAIQQTASTTATQLASNTLTQGVSFYILSTNTGTICVGPTSSVTTSNGYCMSTANGISAGSLGVNNTNLIYVIGTNNTDKIFFLGN